MGHGAECWGDDVDIISEIYDVINATVDPTTR